MSEHIKESTENRENISVPVPRNDENNSKIRIMYTPAIFLKRPIPAPDTSKED